MGDTLKPEDVSQFSDLEKCFNYLEKENIDYEHLETVEEMQERIRQHLEELKAKSDLATDESIGCARDNVNNMEKNSQILMHEILSQDQKMKDELSEIYISLLKFVKCEIDEEITSVVEKLYGDLSEVLVKNKAELTSNECPIVVAGEVSAGKSSLLNLILGTNVLPHSLLCATSTICRLHNSQDKKFEILMRNGEIVTVNIESEGKEADKELTEKLKPYVSSTESRQDNRFKQVEIYWPIPMLQDRVTIVDTPGVGESEEMTERLLEYLPNAVAFIYVVNSANAGGIQEDRLVSILNKQKKWQMEGKLAQLDFSSMMFVCNKWDVVKKRNEEEKVWEDTLKKIQDALPTFPESQVFKMSATEADRYKKSNMGNTSEFGTLLDGIEKLIPKSLRAKLARHYKFIDRFLHELLTKISSRINHARKTQEDKNRLYEEVLKRLNKLNLDSDRVREGLKRTAKAECQMIVQKLLEHLHSDSVQERLLSWQEEDAPNIEADDFDVTKFKADKVIGERIMNILNDWEQEFQMLKDASKRLTAMFKEECRLLGDECETVNVLVEGLEDGSVGSALGITSSSSQRQDELFTKSEKIILAFASPLWVPLVTAASILFLPVGIGMFVRETFKASKQRKDYTENKEKYMKEWTKQITETTFTEEHIGKLIFDVYFGTFERNIERVCSDFIPKQIEADQRQVNLIANDRRTSHQILEQYTPMLANLKVIKGQLYLYELHYMTTDLIDPREIHTEKEIGRGNFSDVYLATWKKCNGELRVALKVLRRKMKGTDMLNQLEEVDILRKLKHANIVELYGLCYTPDGERDHDSRLSLVMELCDDSLEHMVFENENLQCRKFKKIPDRHHAFRFYIRMAVGVCDGLAEMHRKGYLHRDLKLSNVLVKHQTAKLCDLGFARMEFAMTGTFVGTMSHMSPEILKNEQYTFSSDIYSLGILLWELWYGRHAYSEPDYKSVQAFQLLDAIKTGTRPRFVMFIPINELKDLIESCWNDDPQKRPTALEVSTQLKEMFSKHHKESL